MEILPASLFEPCLHGAGQAEYGAAGVMNYSEHSEGKHSLMIFDRRAHWKYKEGIVQFCVDIATLIRRGVTKRKRQYTFAIH